MKAEYVNLFIKAFVSVGEMVLGGKLTSKKPFIKTKTAGIKDVAVLIGVTGQLKGQVAINFEKETAIKIASFMMGGMEITELDDIAKSAVSEVGNMVMGNASTELSNVGISTDITPPNLIVGQNMFITNIEKTIVVPFDSQYGEIYFEIAIEENV
jgi:chemotaxis protein CheX